MRSIPTSGTLSAEVLFLLFDFLFESNFTKKKKKVTLHFQKSWKNKVVVPKNPYTLYQIHLFFLRFFF